MIGITNITFFISNRCIFSNVNFQISRGDRIGLVGPNGAGKTTLLRLITGKYTPENGQIEIPKGVKVGYLEQEVHEKNSDKSIKELALRAFDEAIQIEKKIHKLSHKVGEVTDFYSDEYHDLLEELEHLQARYELLEGDKKESKTEEVLEGLGFKTHQLDLPLSQFSGGWRMRVALAKILLEKPDLLLLDEPTNHLDIDSIEWLEQYLYSYDGAVVIVSHDQYFLNRLVTSIFEVRSKKIFQYEGNYDAYLDQREEQIEQQQRTYEAQQKIIADAEKFIDRFRYKATKAKQVQSRIKQLEKMDMVEEPEPQQEEIHFHFPEPPRSGKVVLNIDNLIKTYSTSDDNKPVKVFTEGQDLEVERGDKIAIVGANGAGKSTLARIVNGIEPFDGTRKVGHNVQMTFFAQHLADVMESGREVLEEMELSARTPEARAQVRTILGCFLFTGDDVFKKIDVLSGGERSRLALAKTLLEPANLLILDEPTNHLDINSKNILLDALKEFQGTVIAISHDRHFLAGFATKIWRVENGRVKIYPGNYEYYQWKRKKEQEEELKNSGNVSPKKSDSAKSDEGKVVPQKDISGPKSKEQKRFEAQLRNRFSQKTKPIRNTIHKIEKKIDELESRKEELEVIMANPETYQDGEAAGLTMEYQQVESDLDKILEEWAVKTEELEHIEEQIKAEIND